MTTGDDFLILSTGRKVCIAPGVWLTPLLVPMDGYGNDFPVWPHQMSLGQSEGAWSKTERQELADYMIDLWQKFRAADAPQE